MERWTAVAYIVASPAQTYEVATFEVEKVSQSPQDSVAALTYDFFAIKGVVQACSPSTRQDFSQ